MTTKGGGGQIYPKIWPRCLWMTPKKELMRSQSAKSLTAEIRPFSLISGQFRISTEFELFGDSRQKLNFDKSLELNYFELAQKFQVYAPFIDFLKILWSWKKWQKLTKNNPKIGKFVLNDIFWAIFTKLDIIHLNMLSPSQVRNFFHFMEKVFFKSWVFSLLTVWILILEIYTIYS